MKTNRNTELNVHGIMMIMEGMMVLCSLIVIPFYPQDVVYLPYFAVPGGLSILAGMLLHMRKRPSGSVFQRNESSRIVLFSWGYGFLLSAVPFLGGVGFVMMIFVFVQDKDSMEMYSAEGRPDKLMPNIGMTAKVILLMYSGFLVVGTILYIVSGMPVFDSMLHAMCALSTGGFSNKLASIGAYQSVNRVAGR